MAKKKMTLEEKLEEAIVKDVPYEVPENWIWTNLEVLFDNVTSSKKKLKQKEYENECKEGYIEVIDQGESFIGGYTDKKELAYYGELPVIIFGDHSKCIKFVDFNFVQGADGVKVLLPRGMNRKYLYYMMKNLKLPDKGYSRHYKFLIEEPMPIAPLSEQQRIVDKIESLFEKLDKAKELIEEARNDFEKRKLAILEKAFRGELTKEWRIKNRTDRCYDVLMHEIKNRNEIYSKVNKKNKPNFMNYGENDILIDKNLPGNWIKCPVGLICDCIVPGRDKPKSFTGDIPWITIPNVISDYINTNSSELKLSDAEIQEVNAKVIPIKSVIMSCVGRFGISAIVDKSCVINQQLHAFLPYEKLINPKFLMYHIRILRTYMESIATSTTIAYVNKSGCNSLPINLPPIEEQKEIVRILDKLLEEESKIEELTVLEEQIELIKKSILAKAFRGQLGTNCEDDENALELLKEILNKE